MLIEINEAQAKLVKEALLSFIGDKDLWEERLDELDSFLGEEKAKEAIGNIFTNIGTVLEKFKDVEKVDETYGYDMGLAQIFQDDIYKHITDEYELDTKI